MQTSGYHQSRSMSRSCSYAARNFAKVASSDFIGYLKEKNGTMIYEEFLDSRNREFCCKGYYVNTA